MHTSTGLGLVANVLIELDGWDIVLELAPRKPRAPRQVFETAGEGEGFRHYAPHATAYNRPVGVSRECLSRNRVRLQNMLQ